jgi:hypothetical protein
MELCKHVCVWGGGEGAENVIGTLSYHHAPLTAQLTSIFYKVVPVLSQVPRHVDVGGSRGIALRILNLGTRWKWVVSCTPLPIYPGERTPGTNLLVGWVGPRACQDAVEKKNTIKSAGSRFYTQPSLQWAAGVQRPGREADHSPVPNTEFKIAWSCTTTLPYIFMAWQLVKHGNNLSAMLGLFVRLHT